MTIPLPPPLRTGSSCQPGPLGLKHPCGGIGRTRPAPREAPIRHCSGRGLPCHSCCQDRGGLLPHRFTITAPVSDRGRRRGCLFSVALSLGLPRPGVTRRPCFMESGLSSARRLRAPRGHPAIRARRGLGPCPAVVKRHRRKSRPEPLVQGGYPAPQPARIPRGGTAGGRRAKAAPAPVPDHSRSQPAVG